MNKKKLFLLIAVIAVILIIIFSCSSGKSNAEKVASDYIKASYKGDTKKMADLTSDLTIEASGCKSKKLYANQIDSKYQSIAQQIEDTYGDKFKFKVSVVDSYDDVYDYYDNDGITSLNVTVVVIRADLSGKKETFLGLGSKEVNNTENWKVTMVEENGKWKVLRFD